ncbi:leucine--tRNA ligase [candidate division WOR-3 bacterium]|nr:leucine--tRNA ligase [candidate division WOR-3 bacterium]
MTYNFKDIEARQQKYWDHIGLPAPPKVPHKKYYILEMYPYPSGDLHMGHLKNYVIGDTLTRYKLMCGYDILHPIGWDAFGLPAEECAIEQGVDPEKWTLHNIQVSRSTFRLMGMLYDWDREITTCLPDYYKWTQWLFLKLYEHGLVYRKKAFQNWCPHCQTVLANEQVEAGRCWRCETPVRRKELKQWFFKITQYAERLLTDINKLNGWPERVKTLQKNWIGKSEGLEIDFSLPAPLRQAKRDGDGKKIPIFTTRPDTIYGVTFIAIAPENELAKSLGRNSNSKKEVLKYIENSLKRTEIERTSSTRVKDGVNTGKYVINPLSGKKAEIWIADYVLPSYGTGVVMGVPAHDQRDFEFAKKYKIPIEVVIQPKGVGAHSGSTEASVESAETLATRLRLPLSQPKRSSKPEVNTPLQNIKQAYAEPGVMINSGQFNGLDSVKGVEKIIKFVTQNGIGRRKVNYRLRDWLISRQRYWGAPIPMIHCKKCGVVPVPFHNLPVYLPKQGIDFTPKGKSPLSSVPDFINTKCPKCGNPATRDPDTMDTFVDSAWYEIRYLDPKNEQALVSKKEAEKWLPVDQYIGGVEYATTHLLYFRFITKFLYDIGVLPVDEPVENLFNQGLIKDETGQKMSKSKGNAVPVGPFLKEWGADIARLTILFLGPPSKDGIWSVKGIQGVSRFLNRVYKLVNENASVGAYGDSTEASVESAETLATRLRLPLSQPKRSSKSEVNMPLQEEENFKNTPLYRKLNLTISKVEEDLNSFGYNTAIASLMEFTNELYKTQERGSIFGYSLGVLIKLLAPFAPHLSEELWHELAHTGSVFKSCWPGWKEVEAKKVTLVIEINGKPRATVEIPYDLGEEEVKKVCLHNTRIEGRIKGKNIKKIIFVQNKLINFVM